jgi:hypothetical protein
MTCSECHKDLTSSRVMPEDDRRFCPDCLEALLDKETPMVCPLCYSGDGLPMKEDGEFAVACCCGCIYSRLTRGRVEVLALPGKAFSEEAVTLVRESLKWKEQPVKPDNAPTIFVPRICKTCNFQLEPNEGTICSFCLAAS